MTLDELVERVVDLTLQYQGSGLGSPHDAIRDEVQTYLEVQTCLTESPGDLDALALKALQDACREVIKAWAKGTQPTSKALHQLGKLLPEKPEVWP